jgi:hypothetical protein
LRREIQVEDSKCHDLWVLGVDDGCILITVFQLHGDVGNRRQL